MVLICGIAVRTWGLANVVYPGRVPKVPRLRSGYNQLGLILAKPQGFGPVQNRDSFTYLLHLEENEDE